MPLKKQMMRAKMRVNMKMYGTSKKLNYQTRRVTKHSKICHPLARSQQWDTIWQIRYLDFYM